MENFVAKVTEVNGAINSFAWGPLMLLLLSGVVASMTKEYFSKNMLK